MNPDEPQPKAPASMLDVANSERITEGEVSPARTMDAHNIRQAREDGIEQLCANGFGEHPYDTTIRKYGITE